ncbi:small ribosomal subunit protein eS24-like [Desmodus rotundus]|uniref:small ribosomal subunit protein eS24-like n=1 Tax=Desmodus rotundus TaxID=9430 RepID=UPI0039E69D6D
MNDAETVQTRKFMIDRLLRGNKWSSKSFNLGRQEDLRQKFRKNEAKCTGQHQMSSLYLDSEPFFVVARQLTDFGMIYDSWIMQKKMNLNVDLKEMACMRSKRSLENQLKEWKNRVKEVRGLQGLMLVLAKSELEAGQQELDSLVTLFVVTLEIFHEKSNKLRT